MRRLLTQLSGSIARRIAGSLRLTERTPVEYLLILEPEKPVRDAERQMNPSAMSEAEEGEADRVKTWQ